MTGCPLRRICFRANESLQSYALHIGGGYTRSYGYAVSELARNLLQNPAALEIVNGYGTLITTMTETVGGVASTYAYSYDDFF